MPACLPSTSACSVLPLILIASRQPFKSLRFVWCELNCMQRERDDKWSGLRLVKKKLINMKKWGFPYFYHYSKYVGNEKKCIFPVFFTSSELVENWKSVFFPLFLPISEFMRNQTSTFYSLFYHHRNRQGMENCAFFLFLLPFK